MLKKSRALYRHGLQMMAEKFGSVVISLESYFKTDYAIIHSKYYCKRMNAVDAVVTLIMCFCSILPSEQFYGNLSFPLATTRASDSALRLTMRVLYMLLLYCIVGYA